MESPADTTTEQLINELGALKIEPGAYGPVMRQLEVDICAPNNITVKPSNPQEARALLAIRFGESELDQIMADPEMANIPRVGDEPDWFAVSERIERNWLHEFRSPIITQIPFRARFHDKVAVDTELRVWQVIGLSPQGWAAILAARGESSKRYLFSRHISQPRDVHWVQVAGFDPLPGGRNPIATHIDRATVTMLFGSSRRAPDGTMVNDFHAVQVALDKPREPARTIPLPLSVPNAVDIAGHQDRILVVHQDGSVSIIHTATGITYAIAAYLPAAMSEPDTTTPPKTNPLTGEPLEDEKPATETPSLVHHAIVKAVHDQCDPDAATFSTSLGWIIHARIPPADTPAADAPALLAQNMKWYAMGCDAKLGDSRFKTPSQEPAAGLYARCSPGKNDVSLGQCGAHVTFRCDAANEVFERTQMVPRFPAYQAPDCGPMNCIAQLGTTLVVHTQSNKLVIASLVPDLQNPSRDAVRFRSGTHGHDSPIAGVSTQYPSLCVTVRHIYWLLPDGSMVFTTPCSEAEHRKMLEFQKKPTK